MQLIIPQLHLSLKNQMEQAPHPKNQVALGLTWEVEF